MTWRLHDGRKKYFVIINEENVHAVFSGNMKILASFSIIYAQVV
jgi:fructosamine-3-kinase